VLGEESGVADAGKALVFAKVTVGGLGDVDGYFDVNSAGDGAWVKEVIGAFVLELVHLLDVVVGFDLVFHRHLGLNCVSYCCREEGIQLTLKYALKGCSMMPSELMTRQ